MGASKVISIAKGEVGYHEGKSGGHWNNKQKYSGEVPGLEWSDYQAWCATFVSWVALKAGVSSLFPRTASCATGVSWFRKRGRFSAYPAIGAQVFYGPGGGTHTGIVYAYDDNYIWTYEGNTNGNGSAEGDGTYAKKRPRKSAYVYGYGYPDYAEGIVCADPAWKGRKGVVYFGHEASTADIPKAGGGSTVKKYEPFPGADWFKKKPKSAVVTAMGKRLVAEGCSAYKEGPGAQWTDADRNSFRLWQKKLGDSGSDADGWPGPKQWDALKVPAV
ncbi:peptidoglycan-binding protein [Streptomyces alfalfae]|uniref:peptidoglycan-binding protein n=1 Tax=Streptomyces alfalfae TaxID=1642299 RepID=UPI001BA82404|nr:peptidoglycan-binding protein [Streptomyces alfalfae]QUI30694.1 peptidoglycan-binding protein [Streptomyces alfalfae]